VLAEPAQSIELAPEMSRDFAELVIDHHLERPLVRTGGHDGADCPFQGGWIGMFSYEFGAVLEPTKLRAHTSGPGVWPGARLFDCERAWCLDAPGGAWNAIGSPPKLDDRAPVARKARSGAPRFDRTRTEYEAMVARAVEYIRAGDVYQVNLAHRVSAPFEGSCREWFARWMERCRPAYGAYLDWTDGEKRYAVASASPELFLEYDPAARRVRTRPMKGTRPLAPGMEQELERSAKDRAELAMIVDLMRNDVGRSCELGSVRVDSPRTIETHDGLGVLQATATVSGTLRGDLAWHDALFAAFPPGSVTGAPKLRAMQIIEELEGRPRGPYCGAIGFVSDSGHWALNVAIRTAVIEGDAAPGALDAIHDGTISYFAGAGIVADSDPRAEWDETLHKAESFLRALNA
jgi:para-aminobenzoate synthetase component 1